METEGSVMTRHLGKLPMSYMSWGAALTMGLVTLIIGAILIAAPTASLAVIAILLGVVMVVSGCYYLVRALRGHESHERAWRGVCGVVFILAGLALLRHLSASIALIGLIVGFTWVIQGVLLLMESFSRVRRHAHAGWSTFFGIISLCAGIVVIATPIASAAILTMFLGCWFVVLGAIEIWGSFVMRRAVREGRAAMEVSVPQQRAVEVEAPAGTTAGTTDKDLASHTAPSRTVPGAPGGTVPGEHDVGRGTAGDSRPPTDRNFPG